MKGKLILIAAMALLQSAVAKAQLPPTMGWSSWNAFHLNINEDIIKGQADAMVSTGLKDAGYQFINIDDGYFYGRHETSGALLVHPERFPNGLRPIVDYIHARGLKAGIYSDAGINTCGSAGNPDTSGRGVGLYGHDRQDLDMFFNDLDFDFIKVDFCGGRWNEEGNRLFLDEKVRYSTISRTMKDTQRPDAILNVCRWAYPGTWVSEVATSWRTTHDIVDTWSSVKSIIGQNLYLSAYCTPGHYNDMDMLEVGRGLTEEEDRTHFGLWCIMNSPLLIGCDMRNIRPAALELMKNPELIAINQDTLFQQAYVAKKIDKCFVLVKDIERRNGTSRAFALYNPMDEAIRVSMPFQYIDLGGSVRLRDLFERKDLGSFVNGYDVVVPAHGCRIYRADAEQRLTRVRYEAETAYISDYQEVKNNQAVKTGIYVADDRRSGGFVAGWLGQSEQNDLQWRNVWVPKSGKYVLTVGFVSGDERNMTLTVNGKKPQTVAVNSGSWTDGATQSFKVKLKKGNNIVRLSNPTDWMPDIDYMEINKP